MADISFNCPSCNQHITADSAWVGQQIQCPVCNSGIVVPASAGGGAPPPPPPARPGSGPHGSLVPKVPEGTKLALNQNAQQPAPVAQKNIPIRNLAPKVQKKQGPWKSLALTLAMIAVIGVGAYFGWSWYTKKKAASDETAGAAAAPAEPGAQPGEAAAPAPVEEPPSPEGVQRGEAIPSTYTLDLASAKTPDGRVNGSISGTNFVADIVKLDALGPSQVLRFCQGELMSPDRELLVYLNLKEGEKLEGRKITVTSEQRTRGLPQVIKRWKNNPLYAPTVRSYASGYALQLEFTQHTNGFVKGKIYVALPDKEQTFAAGSFTAPTAIPPEGVPAPGAMPGAAPQTAPVMTTPPGAPGTQFRDRYSK